MFPRLGWQPWKKNTSGLKWGFHVIMFFGLAYDLKILYGRKHYPYCIHGTNGIFTYMKTIKINRSWIGEYTMQSPIHKFGCHCQILGWNTWWKPPFHGSWVRKIQEFCCLFSYKIWMDQIGRVSTTQHLRYCLEDGLPEHNVSG